MGVLGIIYLEQGSIGQKVNMIHNSPICSEDFVTHEVSIG